MTNVAVWGELFSNAAKARGARGFLTDGCHRDTRMVLDLGFPVFSRGPRPVDISGRGTVISIGRPVEVAGVVVRPGDVVFAEVDGVVIIPQDVAEETMSRAFEKVAKEDGAREDLRDGTPPVGSLVQVSRPLTWSLALNGRLLAEILTARAVTRARCSADLRVHETTFRFSRRRSRRSPLEGFHDVDNATAASPGSGRDTAGAGAGWPGRSGRGRGPPRPP